MFDWNAGIIEGVEGEDTSPNKIVTRTARRIAAKGFQLLDVRQVRGVERGFNWGRSSHGSSVTVLWTITFEREGGGDEFAVVVAVSTTTYTKCNPYDRAPKGNGAASWDIRATDPVKAALGWHGQREVA